MGRASGTYWGLADCFSQPSRLSGHFLPGKRSWAELWEPSQALLKTSLPLGHAPALLLRERSWEDARECASILLTSFSLPGGHAPGAPSYEGPGQSQRNLLAPC